ncbi:hypothetical protein FEM48_Zijuj05G0023600 [Ziziphus jujuba var. spinosa]|uniref:NB-ARC domain-containing protein n=1 Tax=Ziziphus jujuba var. spinosa TaxID=714518 RepID=A0A978VC92_ZIZJJ|nr:hypothetical protein FEM48_Zijuj05G0023600 [Ziziphus jujuba var. spinosa]
MENWKDWFPVGTGIGIEVFPKLKELFLRRCPKLEGKLPDNLPSLAKLVIGKCDQLVVSIPSHQMLNELNIDKCKELVQESNVELKSLRSICLNDISNFRHPTEGFMQGLIRVEDLKVTKPFFKWGLQRLTSLRELVIRGKASDMVCFPPEEQKGVMLLPKSLIDLKIFGFPNLEYLSTEGFRCLTSLEYLTIGSCGKLKSFPKEGLPLSLLKLQISDCPLIEEQCRSSKGRLWPLIAHIPYIEIEDTKFKKMNSEINKITGHLLDISERKNKLGLNDTGRFVIEWRRPPSSSVPDGPVIGRDQQNVVNFDVVGMVGVPGVGKTSLAGLVCNDDAMKHFDIKVWVGVSNDFWLCEESYLNLPSLAKLVADDCVKLVVSIPRSQMLCELDIKNCKEVMCENGEDIKLLRSIYISHVAQFRLSICYCEGFTSLLEEGFPPILASLFIQVSRLVSHFSSGDCRDQPLLKEFIISGKAPDMVSFLPEEQKEMMLLPKSLFDLKIFGLPNLGYLSSD